MATIAENLARVRKRIAEAAIRAGRDVSKIKLVAVSKGQSLKKIEEAVAAGVDILGENFVQEAKEKIAALGTKVSWHFVGHLQTNKAKYAARLFDLIHSLDSMRLAEELNRQGEKLGKRVPVLVQINISGEETKFGVERDQAVALVKGVTSLPHLEVLGLMTITPLFHDPEKCRPYYRALRHIRHQVVSVMPELDLKELSMGMSADFEAAVEEGATLVRVGTAIFGPRDKK